jgi:hypothetical protein
MMHYRVPMIAAIQVIACVYQYSNVWMFTSKSSFVAWRLQLYYMYSCLHLGSRLRLPRSLSLIALSLSHRICTATRVVQLITLVVDTAYMY